MGTVLNAMRRRSGRAVATALLLARPAVAFANEVDEFVEGRGHANHPLTLSGDLALWSGIVFLLFLLVLWKLAWKPLAAGLDARERRIRDDIGAAEQARLKAERMLSEHAAKLDRVQDEVKAILAEARRDADVARQNIVADAQAEANATKNRAVAEIERVKDQALKELFDHMAARVADATEQVLGRGLTVADQDRLIDESLARVAERPPVTRA